MNRLVLRGVFIAVLVCALVQNVIADVIVLYDGNVLLVERAWIEGGEVKYETSRGIQSLPR